MNLFKMALNFFDGEGAQSASGAQGNATHASGGEVSDLSNVVYGKPEAGSTDASEVSETVVTSNTLEERRNAYRNLIQGEYKDLYTEDTQKMINKRFKGAKENEAKLQSYQPLIDLLMEKYKTEDLNEITEKFSNDGSLWEEEAYEAGMTVEQYRKFKSLERENKRLLEAEKARQGVEYADERVRQWTEQAEALQQKYPGFDMRTEVQNEDFQRLLRAGCTVEMAYQTVHMDEIVQNAMTATASKTEKNVISNVRAKGARPSENGQSSTAPFVENRRDPRNFTKEDMNEIVRRVQRGEKIYL